MDELRPEITERAMRLGSDESLAAIVARPVVETGLPAVVILNTGVAHRVGHHRKFVALSRRLARSGHTVVRFDFPGLGDSSDITGDGALLDANLAAIRDVVDWVERTFAIRRFVMVGLCSGADQSIIYASKDKRVTGAVLLDPSVPRTRRYYMIDLYRRIISRSIWINFLSGRGFFWTRMRRLTGKGEMTAVKRGQFSRPNLESPEAIAFLEGVYQGAIDNDARLLAVFTAGPDYQHNYREQILEALPKVRFGKRISLHFLKDCDHTFMRESKREYLYALIADWLQSQFPGREPAAPAPGPESTMESVEF
ncbi:alpha/beta fold hydrolase [Hyphomonas sp.]|uniref:alpha/beta fold hydrolase n=1 Tax=Hyphomonas sp. TaxID=87 RepID=UPI0032F090C9|tara:strand:+ start:73516 stop:74445 length:930 start_codon:yes stop_codon:yes gene_type:complete